MEEKVMLVKGKETNWKKITERLQKAVFNPSLKFPDNNNQTPPKGRGFRR